MLFISTTNNQAMALKPITKAIGDMDVPTFWIQTRQSSGTIPLTRQFSILIYSIKLLWTNDFLRTDDGHDPERLYEFLFAVEFYLSKFKSWNLTAIVISSDHHPSIMAIQFAAFHAGIPVDYVLHAHVTIDFPEPLYIRNIFTDGPASTLIYTNLMTAKCQSRIHPLGPIRFEQDFLENPPETREKTDNVGLAFDRKCSILQNLRVRNLLKSDHRNINIRFHPRTEDAVRFQVISELQLLGLHVKIFNESSPHLFLQDSDLIFCGYSSIILDAALFGCIPVCIYNEEAKNDSYGFLKAQLCYKVDFIPENLAFLEGDSCAECRRDALLKYISEDFLLGQLPLPSHKAAQLILNGKHL